MIVPLRYNGPSRIASRLRSARVTLATNTLREAVYFKGTLAQPLPFREGLGALHRVVTTDLKYRPRDRLAFRAWLEEQDRRFVAGLGARNDQTRRRLETLEVRLAELGRRRERRLLPFHRARQAYFEHVCQNQYELAYLLDPVITVHPDEIFFEAFSRDESCYARLGVKHEAFGRVEELECGTTNIDFSQRLASELERIRSYRQTDFDIAPAGLAVSGGENVVREKKIDLPESWVQGFLQVHSTMAMGLTHVRMNPVDLFNVCRHLRRRRARTSPRDLRFELEPGRPGRVVLEPWGHSIELGHLYQGDKPATIRTWGRLRLLTLARLLPLARSVDVYLAGMGLPSIYVLDLGEVSFTLALSGWTDNDWTGGARFDLLTRRLSATADELLAVYQVLRQDRAATHTALAGRTGLGVEKTRSVLSHLCQVGRAMFDLRGGVFRHRDLFFEPFTAKEAQAALAPKLSEGSEEARGGREIFETDNVRIIARRRVSSGFKISGSAKGRDGKRVRPLISVDQHGQIVEARCTCRFFAKHTLTKGPCEHMLALRLAHMSRLSAEDGKGGESAL
jgi:hypothetical protein